jgi:hypothetical protein
MPPFEMNPDMLIEISDEREPYSKQRWRNSSKTRAQVMAASMDMTLVAFIDLVMRYHFENLRKDMTDDQRRRLDKGKMTWRELQNIIRARVEARRRKRRAPSPPPPPSPLNSDDEHVSSEDEDEFEAA